MRLSYCEGYYTVNVSTTLVKDLFQKQIQELFDRGGLEISNERTEAILRLPPKTRKRVGRPRKKIRIT